MHALGGGKRTTLVSVFTFEKNIHFSINRRDFLTSRIHVLTEVYAHLGQLLVTCSHLYNWEPASDSNPFCCSSSTALPHQMSVFLILNPAATDKGKVKYDEGRKTRML